jgi:hypothetical protein
LTLLRVPVPSPVAISVSIDRLSFDPLLVDSTLRFLPTPAVSIAARMFRERGVVDWLGFAALCHCVVASSSATAERARGYEELQDIRRRLLVRAMNFNAMGEVITRDLGLSWPIIMTPAAEEDLSEAHEQYIRLRRTHGRANKSRLRALARATEAAQAAEETHGEDVQVNVRQEVSQVSGTVLGMDVAEIDVSSHASDEYYVSQHTRLAIHQSADEISGGTVGGIEVDRLVGTAKYLPIRLELGCHLAVDEVRSGVVRGAVIQHLIGRYPNWEAECRILLGKFEDGILEGIVIQNHDPTNSAESIYENSEGAQESGPRQSAGMSDF